MSCHPREEDADVAPLTARQKRLKAATELVEKLEQEGVEALRAKAETDAEREPGKQERLASARGCQLVRMYQTKGMERSLSGREHSSHGAMVIRSWSAPMGLRPKSGHRT